jgi:hypothetical protein
VYLRSCGGRKKRICRKLSTGTTESGIGSLLVGRGGSMDYDGCPPAERIAAWEAYRPYMYSRTDAGMMTVYPAEERRAA